MDQMYSNYIRQKIDHNYTDNTFEMKYDCHLYVMSVDHVTSKAAYGSPFRLQGDTRKSHNFMYILLGNYVIRKSFSVYHVRLVDCGYYYDMQ